jgi:hypothetical protein
VETADELRRFERAGVTLGMWWGRAGQVSGGWNSGRMHVRDTRVEADVAAGLAELRLAAARGADEVGLDAVTLTGLWQRRPWLARARRDFPGMNLVTEAEDCDIMHTLAPTFMTFERQNGPAILADWLNPGHESWVMLRWQIVNRENFDALVARGLVPVTMSRAIEHDASLFNRPASPAPADD